MSGVSIDIEESGDGTRRIIVWGHDHGDDLDSGQARQLAAELLAAADTLDDDGQPTPAIYAHTSGPQRALLHAQLDDDANREALLAGMWPHLQAEAESQRLADDRDADGRGEQ